MRTGLAKATVGVDRRRPRGDRRRRRGGIASRRCARPPRAAGGAARRRASSASGSSSTSTTSPPSSSTSPARCAEREPPGGRARTTCREPGRDAALRRARRRRRSRLVGATVARARPGPRRRPHRGLGAEPRTSTGTGLVDTVDAAFGRGGSRPGQQRRQLLGATPSRTSVPAAAPPTCSTSPAPSASVPGSSQDGRARARRRADSPARSGHLPIGDSVAVCGCGRRGCWEASVGLHALLAAVGMPESGTPLRDRGRGGGARPRPTPRVRAGLASVGRGSASASPSSPAILDPGSVVLGGYFVAAGRPDPGAGPTHARRVAGRRPCRAARAPARARSASWPRRRGPPNGRSSAVFSGERRPARLTPGSAGEAGARVDDARLPSAATGSTNSGSIAISAAPSSTESSPRPGKVSRHRRPERRRQRALGEPGVDLGSGTAGRASGSSRRGSRPLGLKMLTTAASPRPSSVAIGRSSRGGVVIASRISPSRATWSAGQRIASAMAGAPTSVSQQPRLPQWHGRPSRVVAQVADLAGVAARRPRAGCRR